jgi:hypothetical protein
MLRKNNTIKNKYRDLFPSIHRSEEVIAEEQALQLTLVAVMGGTRRPSPSPRSRGGSSHASTSPATTSDTIRRYYPEDFLITFSYADDMLRVLHDRPPASAPFVLIFKEWHRQAMASAENLFYRVTLRL